MKKKLFIILGAVLLFALALTLSSCGGCRESDEKPQNQPEKLEAPQNLKAERRVVTWDAVENATGYIVNFENTEYNVNECSFDISFYDIPGTYNVEVMALGDGKSYYDSEYISTSVEIKEVVDHGYDELGFEYWLFEDKSGYWVAKGNADLKGVITIPDYFCDLPVKGINGLGFSVDNIMSADCYKEKGCNKKTTGIKFPAHLEEIGSSAFSYMIRLEEIVIPDSVTEIGDNAFKCCTHLKRVKLPKNLKHIKDSCFADTALVEIDIPDTVERIGAGAFQSTYPERIYGKNELGEMELWFEKHIYSELSSIVIPASVKCVSDRAFYGRENLKNITFEAPDNIDFMSGTAFNETGWWHSLSEGFITYEHILLGYKFVLFDWYALGILKIPEGVTYITMHAFNDPGVEKVIIPEGVKKIEIYAFKCKKLTEVLLPSTIEDLNIDAFSSLYSLKSIYYNGDKEAWDALGVGNNPFGGATVYFYSETAPTTEGNFWHYVDGKPTVWAEES